MLALAIVEEERTIGVLAEPVRREILRLATSKPMTGTHLAKKLGLTKPSISHHLKILQEAKLIKVEKTQPESHGILEKYYRPVAGLFIENWEKIPSRLRRYFLCAHMERLKGALSVIRLTTKQKKGFELPSEMLEQLAEELAKKIVALAKKYEDQELDISPEVLQVTLCSEALKGLAKKKKWQNILTLHSKSGR